VVLLLLPQVKRVNVCVCVYGAANSGSRTDDRRRHLSHSHARYHQHLIKEKKLQSREELAQKFMAAGE